MSRAAISLWNLLLLSININSKVSLPMKQRYQTNSRNIRCDQINYCIWYIPQKLEHTGELRKTKRPGTLWETTVIDG